MSTSISKMVKSHNPYKKKFLRIISGYDITRDKLLNKPYTKKIDMIMIIHTGLSLSYSICIYIGSL